MSLICCLSGKKQSGKNTSVNYIAARYLMRTNQISDFKITKTGMLRCKLNLNGKTNWITIEESDFNNAPFECIKIYSFADPLKSFCMDVFNLTYEQCYGTDEEKNSLTTLRWENMPDIEKMACGCLDIPPKKREEIDLSDIFRDYMTAREVLQYFGTDIIRKMYGDAWVYATLNKIKRESPQLALISDARFPNEITKTMEVGGLTIRLLRNVAGKDEHPSETALDDFPLDQYSFSLDNKEHTVEEQCRMLDPIIDNIFERLGR